MNRYMTIGGLIERENLGHCQPHEHLYIDETPAAAVNPYLRMDDLEKSTRELIQYRLSGGHSVVDAQPVGAGRNDGQLMEIAQRSQISIIASTGFHVPMFYAGDHWIHTASEEKLTELFGSELSCGMFADGRTGWPVQRSCRCAGIVKAAISSAGMTVRTCTLLRAAGRAAHAHGAPVMLHTEKGFCASAAVDLLTGLGLAPDRIIVCHADRQTQDLTPHRELAQKGVYLEYDTIGRFKYHSDVAEISLIGEMIRAGFGKQILLSLDTTANRFLSYGGEIGLHYLLVHFIPELQKAGISEEICRQLTQDNPSQALRQKPL